MHHSGDWPVSTAQAGVTSAATNQAGISTRAPPTTERYWFTTPGHNGDSALPVWQSDCTCRPMAPSTCARQGRTAAFLRWCQRPTIVLKRRMTAHHSSTWLERLRKKHVAYGLVPDYSVRRTSGRSICGPKFITWPGKAW